MTPPVLIAPATASLAPRNLLPPPAPAELREALPPCPEPAALAGRARGALLGCAVGDALGRPAEGLTPAAVSDQFGELRNFLPWRGWRSGPTGTFTDDTQLTVCLARSLIATAGAFDPDDFARRLIELFPAIRGIGRATHDALSRLERGLPWWEAGVPSAGNGSAMRAAPVGLAFVDDVDGLRQASALSCVVTHADTMAVASTVAQAFAVAYAARSAPGTLDPHALLSAVDSVLADIPDSGAPERKPGSMRPVTLRQRIGDVARLLGADPGEAFGHFWNGAYVLESLPAALWCFLSWPEDPEQAIVVAANAGYDADTVAAMAGALAGAYHGEDGLPARWVADVEDAPLLRLYAGALVALADRPPA